MGLFVNLTLLSLIGETGVNRSAAVSSGERAEWQCGACPRGKARRGVMADIQSDEQGSCDAKKLFWHHD